MPNKTTELEFEMNLQFPESSEEGKEELIHDDISCCVIIKAPLIQHASYCILQMNLNVTVFNIMKTQINKNIFPKVIMTLYTINDEQMKQRDVFQKILKCIKIKESNDVQENYDRTETHVDLVLVHPILYELDKKSTFTSKGKHENVLASDVLNSFESFLKETYGNNDDKNFKFNKIGADLNKNEFTYEEIYPVANNDLNIPTHIIQNYKPNNSFCFYFFDGFDFSSKSSDIVCHYINLNAEKEMEQVETICEDTDFTVNLVKNINFNDPHESFNLDGTYVFKNQNLACHTKVIKKESEVPHLVINGEKEENLSDREYSGVQSNVEVKETQPFDSKIHIVYTPDTTQNAINRLVYCSELISNKIISIHSYDVSNCLPEFPQFGKLYNIQRFDDEVINHTPFHLINVFQRKTYKEKFLFHYVRCVFLKYRME